MYLTLIKYGAPALLILGIIGTIYWQQSRIETLNQELGRATDTIQTQKRTIQQIKSTVERNQKVLGEFNTEVKKIRRETGELEKTLSKHDLDELATEKPGLIQNRANSATKELLKNLEQASEY